MYPENNLELRISLATAGRECFLEQRFVAAERLQDGHGWKSRRERLGLRGETDDQNPTGKALAQPQASH
jgi:hypothetical protein